MRTVFTSESVTEGHPDKLCDQISDAVLDAILAKDPMARVACETCATTGLVQVMGEITTSTYVAIDEIARQVIRDIGYTSSDLCFDGNSCAVLTAVHAKVPISPWAWTTRWKPADRRAKLPTVPAIRA